MRWGWGQGFRETVQQLKTLAALAEHPHGGLQLPGTPALGNSVSSFTLSQAHTYIPANTQQNKNKFKNITVRKKMVSDMAIVCVPLFWIDA